MTQDASKVYVSFDWESDRRFFSKLQSWNMGAKFRFLYTPKTYLRSPDYWCCRRLRDQVEDLMRRAEGLIVIVGEYAASRRPYAKYIGQPNWVSYEVAWAIELDLKIVAVPIHQHYNPPSQLLENPVTWIHGFSERSVMQSLDVVR